MSACEVILLIYFVVGFILALVWWNDEYEPQYKYCKESGKDTEDSMAVLLLLGLVAFWPIKFIKNCVEGSVS